MGKETSISWCHHTFNTWWGCFKVSPGCAHCYAATFDRRVHGRDTDHWDRTGSRRFMSEDYWQQPIKWNRDAEAAGERRRVFCGSMCDWAEIHPNPEINRQMDAYRGRLFYLIRATPWLDWLLLTKRIENVAQFLPWPNSITPFWPNVWIGTTAEDQEHADRRIPILLSIPAAVHWLSLEPLLGSVDLDAIQIPDESRGLRFSALQRQHDDRYGSTDVIVDWVVAGAESGHGARPCSVEWLRALRDQCARAGAKFLLKQATQAGSEAVGGPLITIGDGSRAKGKGHGGVMIELPYLDGRQHEEYPSVVT